MHISLPGVMAAAVISATTLHAQTTATWDSVASILQTPVTSPAGYYRYNFPRRDLDVHVGDVRLTPALALTGWLGFTPSGGQVMVMGDLVVTAAELPKVQQSLERDGIEISAVHNHLVGENPQVYYVHVDAHGDALTLAQAFDRVLATTGVPRPVTTPTPMMLSIDTALVFGSLGRSGRASGSVAQVGFNLIPDTVRLGTQPLVPAMAYASPINLQAVTPTRMVATGDFALEARQLQPVRRALIQHGITVTALHSHLMGESPTVYYMHFWADGAPDDVVRGLRAALDAAH